MIDEQGRHWIERWEVLIFSLSVAFAAFALGVVSGLNHVAFWTRQP